MSNFKRKVLRGDEDVEYLAELSAESDGEEYSDSDVDESTSSPSSSSSEESDTPPKNATKHAITDSSSNRAGNNSVHVDTSSVLIPAPAQANMMF